MHLKLNLVEELAWGSENLSSAGGYGDRRNQMTQPYF